MARLKQNDVALDDLAGHYDVVMAEYRKSKLICRTVVSAEPVPNSHTYYIVLDDNRIVIQDPNIEICLDVFNAL